MIERTFFHRPRFFSMVLCTISLIPVVLSEQKAQMETGMASVAAISNMTLYQQDYCYCAKSKCVRQLSTVHILCWNLRSGQELLQGSIRIVHKKHAMSNVLGILTLTQHSHRVCINSSSARLGLEEVTKRSDHHFRDWAGMLGTIGM